MLLFLPLPTVGFPQLGVLPGLDSVAGIPLHSPQLVFLGWTLPTPSGFTIVLPDAGSQWLLSQFLPDRFRQFVEMRDFLGDNIALS